MTTLIADPRVRRIPVRDEGEPLVRLPTSLSPDGAWVRMSLALRLGAAQQILSTGMSLRVVEGHRSAVAQSTIIAGYTAAVRVAHPDQDEHGVAALVSRYVAPLEVAPHVAGAAVDLTLVDDAGRELDLGCALDATPEESAGACCFAAEGLSVRAQAHRLVLADALAAVGLVNYPTEWWHWSYGDRYWALATGAPHALFGPVAAPVTQSAPVTQPVPVTRSVPATASEPLVAGASA